MHRNIEAIHSTVIHICGLIHFKQAHDEEMSTQYIYDSLEQEHGPLRANEHMYNT